MGKVEGILKNRKKHTGCGKTRSQNQVTGYSFFNSGKQMNPDEPDAGIRQKQPLQVLCMNDALNAANLFHNV